MRPAEPVSHPTLSPKDVVEHALWMMERFIRRRYWVVSAVVLVLLVANEARKFGLAWRVWDWLWVSGFVVLFVALKLALNLPVKVQQTLDRLANRASLAADPEALRQFSLRLHERVRRLTAAWAVIVASAIVLAWFFAYGPGIVNRLIDVGMQVAGAVLAGFFVGRAIGYGQLGRRLEQAGLALTPDPQSFDGVAGLRPIGQLYFAQAAVLAIPAGFLAAWWVLIPLHGHYQHWRDAYAGLLAFVVLLEVIAFVAPLVAFHRIMDEGKAGLMIEADGLSRDAAQVRRNLSEATPEQRDVLQARLDWLNERYQAIENMPTWPVTAQLRRRFTGENVVFLLPVVAQVLGLGEPWRQLLEGLKEWAA